MPEPTKHLISTITAVNGVTYGLKDSDARNDIEEIKTAITGGVTFQGTTSTELTDGSTVSVIVINSKSVTAAKGYLVVYGGKEFVYDGEKWIEMGDLSLIGSLGWKNSATGNYTPAGNVSITKGNGTSNYTPEGSVSAPEINVKTAGSTAIVNSITNVGTSPSLTMTYNSSTENLSFAFDQGTLPTKGADQTVKTGDAAYEASAPTFTGTGAELKATFNGTQGSVTVT